MRWKICGQAAFALLIVSLVPLGVSAETADRESALHQTFQHLNDLRPDKAIHALAPLVVHAARRTDVADAQRRELLARYFVLLGRAFSYDENLPAAAHCYQVAHSLDTSNIYAKYYLADAWNRTGRDGDAQKLYASAAADAEKDSFVATIWSRYWLRSTMQQKGLPIALKALNFAKPDDVWKLQQIVGRCYSRMGMSKKAAAAYKIAIAKTPDKYSAQLMSSTLSTWETQTEQNKQALSAAAKIQPDDSLWMGALASLLVSEKDHDGWQYYVEAMRCPRFVSKSHFLYGTSLIRDKRFYEAQTCLDHMQRIAPWSEQTFFLRGALLQAEQKDDEVVRCYNELIAMHPQIGYAYMLLADFYVNHGQFEKAVPVLQNCLQRLPDYGWAWLKLATLYQENHQWQEAKSCMVKALGLADSSVADLNPAGRSLYADMYSAAGANAYHDGNRREAIKYALLFNQNKFVPALPWYLKVMSIRPGRIETKGLLTKERQAADCTMLADMLLQRRQFNDAIKEYKQACELNPSDVNLHTYLLEAYSQAGDWVGVAREDWETSNRIVGKIPEAVSKLGEKSRTEQQSKEKVEPATIPEPKTR